MKLINILKRDFIIPFVLTLICSIIVSIVICIIFSDSYYNATTQSYLLQLQKKQIYPLMQTIQEILFSKYQKILTALSFMTIYYKDYNENLKNLNTITDEQKKFVNSYLINARKVSNDYSTYQAEDEEKYYSKGVWFSHDKNEEFGGLDLPKQIFLLSYTKIIPVIRALYFLYKEKDNNSFYFTYAYYPNEKVFASYPILKDSQTFYDSFVNTANQGNFCKDSDGKEITYYFIECQDWYLQLTELLKKEEKRKVFVSYQYRYRQSPKDAGTSGITFCYINYLENNFSPENRIIFCIDVLHRDYLIRQLNILNTSINGYFYVVSTQYPYPIYYPGFENSDGQRDLTRLEFPTRDAHNIEEISFFKENIESSIIKKYDKSQVSGTGDFSIFLTNSNFPKTIQLKLKEYSKGGNTFSFSIFPIFFNAIYDKNTKEDIHLFSLVYTVNNTGQGQLAKKAMKEVKYLAVMFGFFFFILGGVVLTAFGQLILIFGKNISRPIRDIKVRIKADSNHNKNAENQVQSVEMSNLHSTKNDLANNQKNSLSLADFKEEEENQLIEEDEDEIIPIKNLEIISKFDLVLALKKAFLFLENPQSTFNPDVIPTFISSNEVFNEIQNKVGTEVCLSNIGNLSSLCNKYDKAISFLSDSLGTEEEAKNETKDFFSKLDTYLKKDKSTTTILKYNTQKRNTALDTTSKLDFSRYLKLFYAYRKFFSVIKNKERLLNFVYGMTKDRSSPLYSSIKDTFLYSVDYYVNLEQHKMKSFKLCIKSCICKLIKTTEVSKKDEKILLCLLELFHLEINRLKLSTKRAVNSIIELNQIEERREGEKLFSLLEREVGRSSEIKVVKEQLYQELDKANQIQKRCLLLKDRLRISFNKKKQVHYKMFLYDIHHLQKKQISVLLNYLVLEQSYNYLIAKYTKFCGDYSTAITYYLKVINKDVLVSSAVKYKKANEKIISILNYSKRYPDILPMHEEDKPTSEALIKMCQENIKNLKSNPKDVAIIFDQSQDKKNQVQSLRTIKNIFEKFVASDDRFSFYTFNYSGNVDKIIPFTKKDSQNYGFITSIFDSFYTKNDKEDTTQIENLDSKAEDSFNGSSEGNLVEPMAEESEMYNDMKMKYAIDAIFYVAGRFPDKKITQRGQFIFIFTEAFQSNFNSKVDSSSINLLFKDKNREDKIKLVILGGVLREVEKFNLAQDKFNNYFDSHEFFEYENYHEIRKLITITGSFPRDYEFQNETFDK